MSLKIGTCNFGFYCGVFEKRVRYLYCFGYSRLVDIMLLLYDIVDIL